MTEITIAQTAPVFVAIDIAKARREVLIAVPDKKRRRCLTVLTQLDDFNRLIATLVDYARCVRAALEATGIGVRDPRARLRPLRRLTSSVLLFAPSKVEQTLHQSKGRFGEQVSTSSRGN